jgi:hypothetical protein
VLEAGVSVDKTYGEFHNATQTVSDVKKNHDNFKQLALKIDVGSSTSQSDVHRKGIYSHLKTKTWKK